MLLHRGNRPAAVLRGDEVGGHRPLLGHQPPLLLQLPLPVDHHAQLQGERSIWY